MRLANYVILIIISNILYLGCSSSSESWYEEAKARMKKGDLITAREAIEKALEKNPGYSEAYNLRGVINFQEKKIEEAILDYQKSVDLKPSNYLGQLNLTAALMEKNAWNDAVYPIEKLSKLPQIQVRDIYKEESSEQLYIKSTFPNKTLKPA